MKSVKAETEKLVDAAEGGGFKITPEGVKPIRQALLDLVKDLARPRYKTFVLDQAPQLGDHPYGHTIAKHDQKSASQAEGSAGRVLRQLAQVAKQADEALARAAGLYKETENQAFLLTPDQVGLEVMSKLLVRVVLPLVAGGALLAGCTSTQAEERRRPRRRLRRVSRARRRVPPRVVVGPSRSPIACSLLEMSDLSSYGKFHDPVKKSIGGARSCSYRQKIASASDKSKVVGVERPRYASIAQVKDNGGGVVDKDINGRKAKEAPGDAALPACTLALRGRRRVPGGRIGESVPIRQTRRARSPRTLAEGRHRTAVAEGIGEPR